MPKTTEPGKPAGALATAPTQDPKPKVAKMRSPAYPAISLETALKRARAFYDKEKRNAANVAVVAKHWEMSIKSSGALVAIAALKSFGLVQDEGSGKERTLKLTDLALRILLDQRPDSEDRQEAIKRAALSPTIHAKLWRKYGIELPSDGNLRHALIFDEKFNENAVSDFITEYKETIAFAGLGASDILSPIGEDTDAESDQPEGDYTMTPATRQAAVPPPLLQRVTPPPVGQPVGASIPVTRECTMTVMAIGSVTQKGIAQLIAYLNLIKGSFPENGEATS